MKETKYSKFLIDASIRSKYDFKLWVRYLNKVIQRDKIYLTIDDYQYFNESNIPTTFQKIFLKLAMERGTKPWEIVVSMSEKQNDFPISSNVLKRMGWQ